MLSLNRLSLWAGIPNATRTRDGRWLCDPLMPGFNYAQSFQRLAYAQQLGDPFLIANCLVGLCFTVPCVLLKVLLREALRRRGGRCQG